MPSLGHGVSCTTDLDYAFQGRASRQGRAESREESEAKAALFSHMRTAPFFIKRSSIPTYFYIGYTP